MKEFLGASADFLCPDTPNYTLFVDTWLLQGEVDFSNFLLLIKAKDGADQERLAAT